MTGMILYELVTHGEFYLSHPLSLPYCFNIITERQVKIYKEDFLQNYKEIEGNFANLWGKGQRKKTHALLI